MTRINFKDVLDKWDAVNQKVWEFDRNDSVGASSVFGCHRQVFFDKSGTEKDSDWEYSWGAFMRGNLVEDEFVVPAMYFF